MLNEKTTLINQLDDQIVALCKVEEIDREIEKAEELKMRVMDTRADISDVMKTVPLHATKVNLAASPAETTMPLVHDKVLKQEIPRCLQDLVKGCHPLTISVRTSRLKRNCQSSPYPGSEGSYSRPTLSGANYDSAVETLQQRFGRTQQIISAHMDEILKITPAASDRPSSLRFVTTK